MSTIENNFAAGTAAISGGFDGSILGQSNYISRLQNNGIAATGSGGNMAGNGVYMPGGKPPVQMPRTVEEGIAMLRRDPSLMPLAMQALQDPRVLRPVLAQLQQKPELIAALPPQITQFLSMLLTGRAGG